MNRIRAILPWITLGLVLYPAAASAQLSAPGDARTPGVQADSVTPETRDRAASGTLTELLRGRAAGLNIMESSGTAGAAGRLWIRGPQSILLSNDPLVVVDGVRVNAAPDALHLETGGQSVSRLDDLSPEEIASVRVLRGPAATALYGPEGAAGVLEIRTRAGNRGEGRLAVHAWSSLGLRRENTDFPANFSRLGTVDGSGATIDICSVDLAAAGICTPTAQPTSFNPLEANSPFRDGMVRRAGARASGSAAGGVLSYGVTAGTERMEGVLDNNATGLDHVRGSLALQGRGARLSLTAAHARRDADQPYGGLLTLDPVGAGLSGPGRETENGGFAESLLDPSRYALGQEAEHSTAGAALEWDVLPWLSVGARGGRDESDARSLALRVGQVSEFRAIVDDGRKHWHWSADATLRGGGRGGALGTLTGGIERLGTELRWTSLDTSSTGGWSRRELRLKREDDALFLRGSLQWGGVLVGGSVRRQVPEFADSVDRMTYSLGGQWSVGDALALPRWLNGVKVRAAHGSVERGLESLAWDPRGPLAVCAMGCFPGQVETLTETEAGVDLRLLERVELGVTGYRRASGDLFATGFNGALSQVGRSTNRGVEVQAGVHGGEGGGLEWRMDLSAAANRNRFHAEVRYPAGEGVPTAHGDGYPMGSYFTAPITGYADADGDGALDSCDFGGTCEVQLGDRWEYAGSPTPEHLGSLAGTLRVRRRVTLYARADWQGGAERLDLTSAYRCTLPANCEAAYDPELPLERQAAIVAAGEGSFAGFIHDADFVRLREVAVTLAAPASWTRRLGGAGLELTFAGHNLALWTDYPGLDPEASVNGPSLFGVVDAYGLPPARTFTTRIDVRF